MIRARNLCEVVFTPGIAGKHVLFDRIRKAGMGLGE